MSLEDKLKELEKSPAFQKKVRTAREVALKAGKSFGSGGVAIDASSARAELHDILFDLQETILARFPGMYTPMFEINGPVITKDGFYQFDITFVDRAVHRDSLYEECHSYEYYEDGGTDGLENVVKLYSHGSKASKHWVAGYWLQSKSGGIRGCAALAPYVYLPKGYRKNPDPFLRNKIDELNTRLASRNIQIILNREYYP